MTGGNGVTDTVFAKALRLFFVIFIVIGMVLGGSVFLFYTYQTKGFVKDLLAREEFGVEVRRTVISDILQDVSRDLKYISEIECVSQYRQKESPTSFDMMASSFLTFIKAKGIYDQIRFIDANGMERVRVNYNSGLPEVESEVLLQDKSKRYYFTDTAKLGPGSVYVSPMDLNVEQGKVEVPFKPMIRFGTPLYNDEEKLVGVIIFNYLADHLLGKLRQISRSVVGQTMLLNSRGYWLLSPNTHDQWGFMFPDGQDKTFAKRNPKLWIEMRANDTGQIIHNDSIYTFTTLYPLDTKFVSSTGSSEPEGASSQDVMPVQYYWKLVSHFPDSLSQGYTNTLLFRIFILGALLFMVAATLSWFLSLAIVRRRLYQARLVEMAHFDLLTGLPNRRLFFDRLEQVAEHAQRYKHGFALLYLDIDDFKHINDTFGHDVGDDLLTVVAKRLKASCRKSDTVARIGGDEFVVIIDQVESRQSCRAVADKVTQAMSKPIDLKVKQVSITLSIGVAMYPDDATESDQLIALADKAMYKAKMSGKDQVSFESK